MNKVTIETLLDDFVSASTEIQGAVMVSPQGQLLTQPIGLSETSTSIMAGSMLQLAGCVSEQCHWNAVDWVTIQALEGYLILTQCLQDIFLLIRSQDVPSGYLLHYIHHYLDRLRTSLRAPDHDATVVQLSYRPTELIKQSSIGTLVPPMENGAAAPGPTNPTSIPYATSNGVQNNPFISPISSAPTLPIHLDEFEIAYCRQQLAEIIGPIASLICDRTLTKNPNLRLMDFVNALAQQIPDPKKSLDFQKRILSE